MLRVSPGQLASGDRSALRRDRLEPSSGPMWTWSTVSSRLPVTKAGQVQYVPLNEEAKQILVVLTVGNRSVWVFPSENPDTHVDPQTSMIASGFPL